MLTKTKKGVKFKESYRSTVHICCLDNDLHMNIFMNMFHVALHVFIVKERKSLKISLL